MKISIFSKQSSDKVSFEELISPHVENLYRLAFHYTHNKSDAEDLVQDLLTKLFPRTDEMRNVENLKAWLAKSLYNLFIDKTRYANRQPVDQADSLDADTTHFTPQSQKLDSPQRHDLIRDLQYALSQLSEEHRLVVVLHDVESYTLEEVSNIYDVPIGTLKSRLHRARAQLRKFLSDGTL